MIKLPQKLHGSRWETGALTNIETGIAGASGPLARMFAHFAGCLLLTRTISPVNRSAHSHQASYLRSIVRPKTPTLLFELV